MQHEQHGREDPDAEAIAPRGSIHPITDREFALFQALIYREAGIYLSDLKKALLFGRLHRRLRELRLRTFASYYRLVTERDSEERTRLFDAVCTNETHFFREPKHFEFLEQRVFAEWVAEAAGGARPKLIRVWSAACSSGEEPYSIAMSLLSRFPAGSGWQVEILATDLSTRALEEARSAVWPVKEAEDIPQVFLERFMLKGKRTQEGKMKAGREIRSIVRFDRLNLNDDTYPVAGSFDLIFCRNVMIYFSAESKARTVGKLLNYLAPSGYLFLGHAESLNGLTDRVRSVAPAVYARPKSAPPSPREMDHPCQKGSAA